MNWRKIGGLAIYVLIVEAIAYYYASSDAVFLNPPTPLVGRMSVLLLSLVVPFLGGVLLAVITVLRIEYSDVSVDAVRSEAVASGLLLVSPLFWYTVYGCVIWACPG